MKKKQLDFAILVPLRVYNASCLKKIYTTCKSVQLHRHRCNVADAKWLACSFFKHYCGALAHPDIALTNPADAVFLTQAALDKLDWTQQPFPGGAWKPSVQAALKQISIEDYSKMSVQRFPQALSSVGIYAAGTYRGLCTWHDPCSISLDQEIKRHAALF